MSLNHWLDATNTTQRELAERLGYKGNGFITLVNKGKRAVPGDDIPAWADALGLSGADRQAFVDEFAEKSIPKWYRDRLAEVELQAAKLGAELARIRKKVVKDGAGRHQSSPE